MSRLTEMEPETRVVVTQINGGADLTGHPTDRGLIQGSELDFHGAGAVHTHVGARCAKTIKSKRRLWEFHPPLICRILGLAFDEREEGKIFNKLGLEHNKRLSVASARHGTLVHACVEPNRVSRYLDKTLESMFEPYRRMVQGLGQEDISRLIEERGELKDVPLPALIWLAIRHQHQEIDRIEARVFSTIHVMEHRALRLYDDLSRMLPDGKPENAVGELKATLRLCEELQKRHQRSEQRREQLKAEMEAIKQDKSSLALALAEQRQLSGRLGNDLEKLGGESALAQIESLKEEIELLTGEIVTLNEELLKREQIHSVVNESNEGLAGSKASIEDKPLAIGRIEGEQDITQSPALNGKSVAFVGGLEGLLPHYRQTVEHLGGIFLAHSGKYAQGKQEIEKLVDKADVVFCPVDINSHHACRHCKRICKLTGKPCYFLRSASLSMFRRELIEFARGLN
ncbi:MAG: hypothetical protein DDT27_00595 [Dehalococcoidia bacterium]|nr:hypothetical protein [Chloroflexota bacterium]